MSSYLDQPTVEKQLAAYMESDDLELDIDLVCNEYHLDGYKPPSREELREEVIENKREQLENRALCEAEGHVYYETADGENGVSYLDCDRCGIHFRCQW